MAKKRPGRRRHPLTYPNLAVYLDTSGDTQVGIALAVGTSQGHVSRIVRGQQVPRPELAARLSRYARVPLDSFVRANLAWRAEAAND